MSRVILGSVLTVLISVSLFSFGVDALASATHSDRTTSESLRANRIFDDIFDRQVSRDPQWQTYLGIKTDYGKWTDISEQHQAAELSHTLADLALLRDIDVERLDASTRLSYELLEKQLQDRIDDYQWRHHSYPVNQMFGLQAQIPAFLINQHQITSRQDAEAYIARLNGIAPLMTQLIEQLKLREAKGIVAPDFVLPHVIRDARNLLTGAPFDGGEPGTLLADFQVKIAAIAISETERNTLNRDAEIALLNSVQPAYRDLISFLESQLTRASHTAGAWKLPDGQAYYNNRLKRITTTDLTAEEIHQLGLSEVDRIHEEMRGIRDKVGFKGSLQEFMLYMREDERFYYPNTDKGREQYLARARGVLETIESRLDELFLIRPRAKLEVKRVEPFREKSAAKAFYQQPAPDGTRPGKYYANLYDMSAMPSYQLEALAYHEGLPGHHMQIAIKQELQDLPKFRRFGGVTAYSEGWGLYSELLPREINLYRDPYADFGRLAMELWRAVRLVVDTGMHSKGWTREESIDYYAGNTPNARLDAVKMVERHAVMPGQATAYKVGMLKILGERARAKAALAGAFDIREFHDVVLRNGAVPLDVLEAQVDQYIAEKKSLAGEVIPRPAG